VRNKKDPEIDRLEEEIKSMPEPDYEKHFNHEIQEKIHQNLMNNTMVQKKRMIYRNVQPVILGMAGIAALLLFITIVIPINNSPFNSGISDSAFKDELEAFFESSMKEMGRAPESYSIFHQEFNVWEKQDALVFFTEKRTKDLEVHMVYFQKERDSWKWVGEIGTTWNSKINWTMGEKVPYLYSGPLNDESVSEVIVAGKQAKIIEYTDQLRFWYIRVDKQFATVSYRFKNGDEAVVERIEQ
jgi:hypothetical protein